MGRDSFRFRYFSLSQEGAGMRISTDGVLLGAWAMPKSLVNKAIDIGTGTGLIAFFMAYRYPCLPIDAFEIDYSSFQCFRRNIGSYPFPHSISSFFGNFLSLYKGQYSKNSIDCIVSNPPYFTNGPLAKGANRQSARYNTTLSTEQIFVATSYLLSLSGTLSLITPYEMRGQLIKEALSNELKLIRETEVITQKGKNPKRILSEWGLINGKYKTSQVIKNILEIRDENGEYTSEYKALVSPYYHHL